MSELFGSCGGECLCLGSARDGEGGSTELGGRSRGTPYARDLLDRIDYLGKKVGDKVNSGDMVLVVESDKADMDVESFEEGYLAAILVKDGEVAEVGAPVAFLAKSQADIPAVQAMASSGAAPVSPVSGSASVAPTPSSSSPAAPVSPAPQVVNSGRVAATGYAQAVAKEQGVDLRTVTPSRPDGLITAMDVASGAPAMPTAWVPTAGTINATPMARKLAAENNIQLSGVKGTGNFGRVTADDVLIAAGKKVVKVEAPKSVPAAAAAPSKEKETKVLDGVVPMDGMQKAVAKNMEKTLSVPIFRVSREIVTDEFDALYAALKPKGVTVSAMLAKAVAETLKKHPIMNAAYVEGGIKYNKDVNVAMAVAMDGGLITPTIVGAQDLDLFSISRKWKELVDKAKNKKLSPAEYSSGTFTISNLGMFGVQQFDAILPTGMEEVLQLIDRQVKENDVMLYMKGTPSAPQCGFSLNAVRILNAVGVDFSSVNVLEFPAIREGVKKYSDWPTIPQLYVKGEFIGGGDIMVEMYNDGGLEKLMKEHKLIE